MKTSLTSHPNRKNPKRAERGMAVIIIMVIISILCIYVAGNLRTLHFLQRDLKIVEQKQMSRLAKGVTYTNSVSVTNMVRAQPVEPQLVNHK